MKLLPAKDQIVPAIILGLIVYVIAMKLMPKVPLIGGFFVPSAPVAAA